MGHTEADAVRAVLHDALMYRSRLVTLMWLGSISMALWGATTLAVAQDTPRSVKAKPAPNCIEQFRRVCRVVRRRRCRVALKEDCAMRPTTRCRDKLVERCTPVTRQVCRNVGGRNDCRYETKRNCRKVIRQVCDRRLERRCKRVPRTVCSNEPETRCERRRFYACSGRKSDTRTETKPSLTKENKSDGIANPRSE